MSWHGVSVHEAAGSVLRIARPVEKVAAVRALVDAWDAGGLEHLDAAGAGSVPVCEAGVPHRLVLVAPRDVPKRGVGSPAGLAALLHAVAHIEWTAVNLALDAAHRFPGLPRRWYGDWLHVAWEEALHFGLLQARLSAYDVRYGDLPAHAGQWDTAVASAHDPLVRMALVPRVNEARGLDVTPGIRQRLEQAGEPVAAGILGLIRRDEVGHVATGDRWFRHLCAERGLPAEETFAALLAEHGVRVRGPLNEADRLAAGFTAAELTRLVGAS